jgi:hypothetical protein
MTLYRSVLSTESETSLLYEEILPREKKNGQQLKEASKMQQT